MLRFIKNEFFYENFILELERVESKVCKCGNRNGKK